MSQKYLPDPLACISYIEKEDELKLLKLLIKSRKQQIANHRPRDPILSQLYIGWQQDKAQKRIKKRINTEVHLGERSKLQTSFRNRQFSLQKESETHLHSKSVQLPYLSKNFFKSRVKDQTGRVTDFAVYKPQANKNLSFNPTKTQPSQETENMKKKLIKVVEKVYKDRQNNTSSEKSLQKAHKKKKINIVKKAKLEKIKKVEITPQKFSNQWLKIDILKLQTYFIKLLSSKQRNFNHQTIEISDIKEQHNLYVPKKDKIPDFIRQYQSTNPEVDIDGLIKCPQFQIIIDDEEIYFGCVEKDKRIKKGIYVCKNYRFQGIWANNHKVEGYEITPFGYYNGKFANGLRNGQGEFVWKNGERYEGEWKLGAKHGSGVWKSGRGDSYIGQWNHGKVEGYGVHISANGQRYEGNFKNFLKNGKGKQTFPNGDVFEGQYRAGKPFGFGKYTWKNLIKYEGQFVEGYRHGKGTITAENYMKFVGNFVGQKPDGKGEIFYENGDTFIGHFKQGQRHGKGTMRLKNSHKVITGVWANDKFCEQVQY